MKRRNFAKILPALPLVSGSIVKSSQLHKKRLFPRRLKKGSKVGLIAPGSPFSKEQYQKSIYNLESLGLTIIEGQHLHKSHGYLAGKDVERLSDLHDMFKNTKIDAIWCLRGGYGCARLLPDLDFKLIRRNPKIFIGYSDATALLNAIYQAIGLVVFHGPVASSEFSEKSLLSLENVLFGNCEGQKISGSFPIFIPGDNQPVEGQLSGGNLSILASLTGTDFEVDMRDKIVFLEDIGEKPYRIDRMLTQLKLAGSFSKAKGFALGDFTNCEMKEGEKSLTLEQTLKDRLGPLTLPVINELPIGHIDDQVVLPIGLRFRLESGNSTLTYLENATE